MTADADWDLLGRRMSPRSVIASLLLGMHPPKLSSARLVRWCELFGVTENATRVTLSRMTERGELRADDGSYELVGAVRSRQTAQDWVLQPEPVDWNGGWILLISTDSSRSAAARAAHRAASAAARLVEVRLGVWTRPDNLPEQAYPQHAWELARQGSARWRAHPEPTEVESLVERFAPEEWHERAMVIGAALRLRSAAIEHDHDALGPAFVAGAAALQHLRRDPLLPSSLVRPDWAAPALRADYLRYQPRFSRAVAAFLRS